MLFTGFKDYIAKNNIFKKGDRVLAAVSGGADSVCLLHLLTRLREEWGIKLYCAHVNHGIRETALRDEDFVKNLCGEWGVPCRVKTEDVVSLAKTEKISEEMMGRAVRYRFFEELRTAENIDVILTGHNKCDQAETVLMHLIRGSALKGLTGIAPKRDKAIGRPLLSFERFEIEEYLVSKGIKWIEDETNSLAIYQRNLLRLEVLPKIKKINPSAVSSIAKCADILRREDNFLDKFAKNCGAYKSTPLETVLYTDSLKKQDTAIVYRIISLVLNEAGITPVNNDIEGVFSLLDKGAGKKITLSGNRSAVSEYGQIVIYKEEKIAFCHALEPGGTVYIKEIDTEISLTASGELSKSSKDAVLIKAGDKVLVRSRRAGDRFYPEGMEGSKKLKDFFIDLKVPRRLRDKIPVITVNGEIACVAGFRRDARFIPAPSGNAMLIHITRKGSEANEE